MANVKFTFPNFSRYYFKTDGHAYNATTNNIMHTEVTKRGPERVYHRLTDDTGQRVVMYIDDIKKQCKELAAAQKDTPKTEPAKRGKMEIYQIREIRQKAANGAKASVLATEYNLNQGTINKIINRKIYPDVQ